ncbi:hypothetical protein EG329_013603 [Mollisiaceae sp. DMI_Dod_QoI]|nr:hypothetical protein EG329_013603 [Helotiales sp. DMI_Dod_QoI]
MEVGDRFPICLVPPTVSGFHEARSQPRFIAIMYKTTDTIGVTLPRMPAGWLLDRGNIGSLLLFRRFLENGTEKQARMTTGCTTLGPVATISGA